MLEIIDGTRADLFNKALLFLKSSKILAVDTETTGIDPYQSDILLISVGNQYQQFVFDTARLGQKLNLILDLLKDPTKLLILHNAKFDYKMLKRSYGITLENVYDTMLAEQLLLKGRKKDAFGLDDVVDKYMSIIMNKDIRKTFTKVRLGDSFSADQLKYSAEDVAYLVQIMEQQKQFLTKHSLNKVAILEMNAVAPTADMELNGMFLDMDIWLKAEATAITERAEAMKELDVIFSQVVPLDLFKKPMINYNSPLQLLGPLKTLMGTPGKNLKSTGEDALKNFKHIPVVAKLLEYREKEKRVSTYGAAFFDYINPITKRIHTDFSLLRTDTGRYASSDPNLQNIPALKAYRSAFTSGSPDYRIITCDYSGMELRILADLSKEPKWIEIFQKKLDAHCEIGSLIYGKTIRQKGTLGPEDPGENAELRRPVKSLNFGVGYGMGPKKLANETGMPYMEAKRIIEMYWKLFPKVKTFFDDFVKESMNNKCIVSPYDQRLRWLDGFDTDSGKDLSSIKNMSMNFPMQSGNASVIKKALATLRKRIIGKDIKILSTVHDEIVVLAHKDVAEEALQLTESSMISEAEDYIKNVPVEVKGSIGLCWEK